MYRLLVLEYLPFAIAALIVVSVGLRIAKLPSTKRGEKTSVLLYSFLFLSEQYIRNTPSKTLKNYYKWSQKHNLLVYVLILAFVGTYFLLRSL